MYPATLHLVNIKHPERVHKCILTNTLHSVNIEHPGKASQTEDRRISKKFPLEADQIGGNMPQEGQKKKWENVTSYIIRFPKEDGRNTQHVQDSYIPRGLFIFARFYFLHSGSIILCVMVRPCG